MEHINKKYYDGFEGEPEIQIIYRKGDDSQILVMWEGYFDQIMRLINPDESGWTGLSYYYNMQLGWYEGSAWKIEDLQMALKRFESINSQKLCSEAKEILVSICDMINEAISNNYELFIARE